MSDMQAKLELSASGKDREKVVVARFSDGEGVVIGRFDLADGEARKRAVDAIHKQFQGLDLADLAAKVEALAVSVEAPDAGANETAERESQADRIVELAEDLFEVFVGNDGEVYAVRKDGPRFALALAGGACSMKANLAEAYYARHGRIAKSAAFGDALLVIEGKARKQPRRDVHLRAAPVEGGYEIDIGDETGRCIFASPGGWEVRPSASVHFRRTEITLPLAEPERGGDLSELWTVMNVAERDRPLVLAYAVGAFMADRESPILMTVGAKGSGKSSIARALISICDPSVADTRTPPTQRDQWSVTAGGSRIVALDNISAINEWQSDAFCRAVTGDAYIARTHYTNKSLSAVRIRIALIITAIDAGALKDDLGDRCVTVEAPTISSSSRVQDVVMRKRLADLRGRILGALLDLLAEVLRELPSVHVSELPRIGDYFLVLLAVDRALGTNGREAFALQAKRVIADVIESDPTSMAILAFMSERAEWEGPALALLKALWPEAPPQGAPKDPRTLSSILRRMAPTLLGEGVTVAAPAANARPRNWRLTRVDAEKSGESSSDRRTVGDGAHDAVTAPEGPENGGPDAPSDPATPTIRRSRRSDDTDGLFAEPPQREPLNGWEEVL